MGLDMYLKTNGKNVCKAANKASGSDSWQVAYGTAIYWRKANAIHKWFVDNVQYGEDDCGSYEVSVEQLLELRDACKKVIRSSKLVEGKVFAGRRFENNRFVDITEPGKVILDPSVAEELLPTTDGFFFGSTGYDEYYLGDLRRTVAGIDAILENIEEYEQHPFEGYSHKSWREKGEPDEWNVWFQYHSSW